jgi:sugar phosphate isomerase/epimerase
MWEFDPDIIGDVLKTIDHPNLRACIDVGHAHLYSNVPFETWLERLAPYIVHAHVNNNDGVSDIHGGLALGACDYARLLPQLRALTPPPSLTLEMDNVADMEASLSFFRLAESQRESSES